MDITQLPFNKLIGLQSPGDNDGLVGLSDDPKYTNHLGTVHASAMLSVAEAGSGAFLAQHFAIHSDLVPVVRRLEAKFRKAGVGQISARCMVTEEDIEQWGNELAARGRVAASVPVEVIDSTGKAVMSATVEWFVTQANT